MKQKMTQEKLKEIVPTACSIAEVLKKLEMSITTSNYKSFHNKIKLYEINISHFTGQSHLKNKNNYNIKTKQLKEILVENSSYLDITTLKSRLLRNNLLVYKCYECELSTWRNMKISLQLDHINGVHNDHRIENLRLLCPNCHSQTNTFCGKNKKKGQSYICECGTVKQKRSKFCEKCAAKQREIIVWPSQESLFQMVKQHGYSETARQLNVSHTTIIKRLARSVDPATT